MAKNSTLNSSPNNSNSTRPVNYKENNHYSEPGLKDYAGITKSTPLDQEELNNNSLNSPQNKGDLLIEFVSKNIIGKNFDYPIKISETTYLTGRSVSYEKERMFVVEDYKVVEPAQFTIGQVVDAMEEADKQIELIFCEDVQGRDAIFPGYSKVGLIWRVLDTSGYVMFTSKIDDSKCSQQ